MIDFFHIKEVKLIFFISFIFIIGFWIFNLIPVSIEYTTYLSVSASLFGFLITTLSILLVFPNEGRIGVLKKHKSFKNLFNIFIFSIFLQIILFSISLFGNLYNIVDYKLRIIFMWFLLISLMFIVLIVWIIKKMIETLLNEN